MIRSNEIKAELSRMESAYDNLFTDRELTARYEALRSELAAVERGEVYKPFIPNYAAGSLQSVRASLRSWIGLAKKSRDRVDYVYAMTAEQHERNLAIAKSNIAKQWPNYRYVRRQAA